MMNTMEEKEEGEISLEDVSSSDEEQSSFPGPWIDTVTSSTRRIHSLRDAGHGKENRHYSRELTARYLATLPPKPDDLLPISSTDDHEIVELPDSSHHLCIHLGKKKRKKKKKKKSSGGGIITMDNFVAATEPNPLILNAPQPHTEITVHRRRRSPNARLTRRHSPFTTSRAISRSPPTTPPRLYCPALRRSPSRRIQPHYSRSPSPRRRSPRRLRLSRDKSPRNCSSMCSRDKCSRKSPLTSSRDKSPRRAAACCRHPSPTYAELHASFLLKKVRRLENVGTMTTDRKHKDSSLKDKLSNILKAKPDSNSPAKQTRTDKSEEASSGEDDDIDILRRLALQTKHKKSGKKSPEPDHLSDNDPEDLELRMIALKSAVIKKHQERVKNRKKKKDKKLMNPLIDSLLSDLEDECNSSCDMSPGDQQVEDMELDTDVEREKESYSPYSPYSPTDDEMRNSPEIYYPNVSSDMEAPYSPTDPTPWVDRFPKEKRKEILTTITIKSDSESIDEAFTPYSPSDTPVYDPELPSYSPDLLEPQHDDNCMALDLSMKEPPKTEVNPLKIIENDEINGIAIVESSPEAVGDSPVLHTDPQILVIEQDKSQVEREEMDPQINHPQVSKTVDADGDVSKSTVEVTGEPLYLRGLPEVTKEPNKIPILVNKCLVPVSILKSNKNLQQPLPQKKIEISCEPVFKSADMQPVDVDTQPMVSTTVFKPIKLQPVMKKSTVVASAAAFNNISMAESNTEGSEDISKVVEAHDDKRKNDKENVDGKASSDKSGGGKDDPNHSGDCENSSSSAMHKTIEKKRTKRGRRGIRPSRRRNRSLKRIKARNEASAANSSLLHDQTNPEDVSNNSASASQPSKQGQSSDKKSELIDEKLKSIDKENLSIIEISRNEISIEKITTEQKKDEANVQTAGIVTSNDKKRRNSIEEDEETLRAILLASLAKRPKSGEISGTKGSDDVANSSEGSPKTQRVVKVPEEVNRIIVEPVKNTEKTCEVVDKQSKSMSDSPVNVQCVELISGPNNTSTPVQKPSIIVQKVNKVNAAVDIRKRLNSSVIKGPAKKIIKKAAIPVSTKVVNNAKKFQNTLMQRKLILQAQGKLMTSNGSISQNLTLNNLKANEVLRPASPMMKASGKVQRLVIKLGEDSDSDSGQDGGGVVEGGGNERAELAIPTTDFEKSVDQFLKEQRKKQETMAMTSTAVTSTPTSVNKGPIGWLKMAAGLSGTPLAVRHLPPSQQEEYKRLKQQILERERQRANRQINTSPGPLSPASPISKSPKPVPPKPSTLTKPSTSTQDPKTPVKIIQITKMITKKSLPIEPNLQKSPQSKSISKTAVTDQSFIINNPSSSSSSSSSQPMKNLSIQIPNDNVTLGGRLVFNKPENCDQNLCKVPSALRILTTDQLNSKFVQVRLKLGERTVILGDDKSMMDHDKSMGELLQCSETDSNFNTTNNNVNAEQNGPKVNEELSVNEPDQSIIQTTQSSLADGGSVTVDSEASTVILPPRDEDNEAGKASREESTISGDLTIVLDDTIEERRVTTPQKSPTRAKSKSPVKENSERIKSDVKAELECLGLLSEEERTKRLEEIERNLVTKRYSVLADLTEMTSTLKQWDLERELQTNLFAEVRRLRAQLAIAEERLLEQRVRIDNIGPTVTKAHKTILEGRAECLKLTKLCHGIGNKVVGQQYKVPVTGAQLMMERLKEVAYHTRQLSKKKVPCENSNNNEVGSSVSDGQLNKERTTSSDCEASWGDQSDGNGDSVNSEAEKSDNVTAVVISRSIGESDGLIQSGPLPGAITVEIPGENSRPLITGETSSPGGSMEKQHERLSLLANSYQSVLTSVTTPRHIDLNRELCPFELTGVCKDDGCLYNHLDPRSQP